MRGTLSAHRLNRRWVVHVIYSLRLVRVCHTCQYGSILPARATRTKAQCRSSNSTHLNPTGSWDELGWVECRRTDMWWACDDAATNSAPQQANITLPSLLLRKSTMPRLSLPQLPALANYGTLSTIFLIVNQFLISHHSHLQNLFLRCLLLSSLRKLSNCTLF